MSYINLPIVSDTDVMIQQALTNIANNNQIPGWVPHEGNLEVLLLEQFALMAAESAQVASNVPDTIFQYFGSLVGITPNAGKAATISTTWNLISTPASPYTIPAGTIAGFYYAGATYQFKLVQDLVFTSTSIATSVAMEAVATGAAYNLSEVSGLNAIGIYMTLSISDPQISAVQISSVNANGSDPETTANFLNRLAQELQLLAPRPITPNDYAIYAQTFTDVYRALAFDGFNPMTNLLSAFDANLTSASGFGEWGTFGDGTVNLPTLQPEGYGGPGLKLLTSAEPLVVNAPLSSDAPFNSLSLTVEVGSSTGATVFDESVSPTHPSIVVISDSNNGNEVVVVTSAEAVVGTGATASQIVHLLTPTKFSHYAVNATINEAQGAIAPMLSTPNANTDYILAASHVKGFTDANSPGAVLTVVATYSDGSNQVYSSVNLYGFFAGTDYPSYSKLISCLVKTQNNQSGSPLAPSNTNSFYASINPYITNLTMYVGYVDASAAALHAINYNNVSQVEGNFEVTTNPDGATSLYNLVPDADFKSYSYDSTGGQSWGDLPTNVYPLPGYGLQYAGTGSPLGGSTAVPSQIFNASNFTVDLSTPRYFTLIANIDTTFAGSTYDQISVSVFDYSVPPGSSGTLATIVPTFAGNQIYVANFELSTNADMFVQIALGSSLNVPSGNSLIVSNIAIIPGTYTPAEVPARNALFNYSWTPGGLYVPGSFNYPRTVTVCPVDSNGLALSATNALNISRYFESKRESNFTVNVINPNYYPIDVIWSASVMPGYSTATVQDDINNAIRNFLSPANWAGGNASTPFWDPSINNVRCLDIAGVISSVAGVSSVASVQIAFWNQGGDTYVTSQLAMPGVASLPIANNVQGNAFAPNNSNSYNTFA